MVAGNKKSGSAKKFHKKVSKDTVLRFKNKKPKVARCQLTGEKLAGVPRLSKAKSGNASKSKKRPERPFGGALSPKATKRVMIERARS
ncbi:MAG: 50S ribosomal protein L34e [Nanobdellota archaeon]